MLRRTPRGLNGIPEWKWDGVWTQTAINARWAEIGAPGPAPLVPASLEGAKLVATRGPRMLKDAKTGKTRRPNAEENDFWNYWMKVAADPYRKQSTASKVAGGVLKVASVVIPSLGVAQAIGDASNLALNMNAAQSFSNLQDKVLAPAIAADNARVAAESAALTAAQIAKIRAAGNVAPGTRTVLGVTLNRNEQIALGLGAAALIFFLVRARA